MLLKNICLKSAQVSTEAVFTISIEKENRFYLRSHVPQAWIFFFGGGHIVESIVLKTRQKWGPPDFVLSGKAESALLSNIVYREGFSEFKRKFKQFRLNFPLSGREQSLPRPGKEDQMVLVKSFANRGCIGVGISLIRS